MKRLLLLLAIFPLFFGCQKESSLTVDPAKISLYVDMTQQITVNKEGATFSVADDFYAKVSNTGLVTAKHIGNTEVIVSANGKSTSVPITIIPQYSLYPDVDKLVGKSKSAIVNEFGSTYETNKNVMGYVDYNKYAKVIMATIENNIATNIAVVVPVTYTTMLTNHLLERYSVAGMQNELYFFINHDKDVVIALQVYSAQYLMVMYMPNTSSKSNDNVTFTIPKEIESYLNTL